MKAEHSAFRLMAGFLPAGFVLLGPALFLSVMASGYAQSTFDPANPPASTTPPATSYNEYTGDYAHQKGPKTVFVFLIEPGDGAAWTNPPSFATLDGQLTTASQNYYNASYHQTWFGPKIKNAGTASEVQVPRLVVSPVLRLSKTTGELLDNIYTQAIDAKALVEALGGDYTNNGPKDPDHFDRWVVMSNTKLTTSTGLAFVGGRISWTGGALSGGVAEHELGHNWGVVHANSWKVAQGEHPRAATGSSEEYQDGWDIMGGGSMTSAFNTLFREDLGFLERSRGEVLDITASGTYRLYDYIDSSPRNATNNVRALLLPMSSFTDYKRIFLGFGHLPGTDGASDRTSWNRNAITVHSGLSDGSNRIDTTPYSRQSGDADDSSVKIGRTYTEGANVNGTQMYGGFSVTPVLRGSTVAGSNTHEWIDVVVHYGAPSANAPAAGFAQSIYEVPVGSPLALAVSASDADGDTLAYDWDFGDGAYSIASSPSQSKTWATAGIYLVSCTVSDMKGKTTTATCWVNVGGIAQRAADNPSGTLSGIYYRYYEGTFTTMPDFNTLLPVKSGTVANFDISPRNRNDNFAFQFEGYIDVPSADVYTFKITSDDGARLYIGNTLVVDNNGVQASAYSKSGNIALGPGKHKIRVDYFHKDGTETLALAWNTRTSGSAVVANGSLSQLDPAANAAPVVSVVQPLDGAEFIVNSDILLQADASDADGIASVVFFADGSYLGMDSTAPFTYAWSKVSVGTKSVVALAYDNSGRWTQSPAVTVHVVSPAPQPSVGLNLNTESVTGGSMYFNDVSGAVYQQSNWVNLTGLSGSAANVSDHLGNPTSMSVSWVGTANSNYGDGSTDADTGTGPGRMFKGLAEIRSDEAQRPSLTASQIPYPQYDVYVYFDLRGSNAKDTLPQRFVCTPTEGAAPADIYGKNSLSASDAVGDYPVYDTWVGFKEATAATATASQDALLGNYVVFRNLRSQGFTVKAERQIAGTAQVLGFNAVQIVRSNPTAPFVYIRQTGGSTAVTEGGTGDSYSVALGYAPDTDVTVTVNGGSQLTANPATLTFTPLNWNMPQAVNVSAVDDSIPEGAHSGTLNHTVSAAGNYSGVTAVSLGVTITDNDQPMVTVSASGSPAEAATPSSGLYQFVRSATASLSAPLTVSFQMGGTAALSGDYTLGGASVSYNPATGSGTVTIPAGQAQVFLTLTPVNDGSSEGIENALLTLAAGSGYVNGSPSSAALAIRDDETVDYFTEFFESAGAFDLNGKSLTFTPSGGGYSVSSAPVTAFPSGTSGFASYNESAMTGGSADDGWWSQSLAVSFPFFGVAQSTAYVGTNGYITFGWGKTDSAGLSQHFLIGVPRISGLMRDLDPGAGGTVGYKRDTTAGQQRSVFYWNAVRNYSDTATVNFQIELFDDGRIRMTWLSSSPVGAAITGLSSGVDSTSPSSPYDGTGSKPFFESDLSAYNAAGVNNPPAFASLPVRLATTGQAYAYAVAVTDPDNNPLTISAVSKPAWLTLSDQGNGTAGLAGTPATPGTYPVVLEAGDGTTTVQQSFSIIVVPAGGNSAPQFTSVPLTSANAGSSYSHTVTATDADGHALSFSAAELPGWLSLADQGNGTAILSGTVPDTGVQDHPVTLLVSDGLASTGQSFVIALNRAPVISLSSPASGFTELSTRELGLMLEASVADDSLPSGGTSSQTWSLVSGPGTVTWGSPASLSTTVQFSTAGWHILRLTASDGAAQSTRDVHVFVESSGSTVAANGLQGWWKFDEGTGSSAADSSGNNRTLALTSATMAADGYSGKAYTGDASATQSAENASYACPSQVTMSAWVYAGASPSTNDRYLFNFHASNNSRMRVYLPSGGRRLRLLSDRTTDGLWEAQYDLPAQQWVHVAVSYDSTSAAADPVFYINGRSVPVTEIGTAPAGAQVSSSAFRVGGNNSANNAWIGRIDEVRVYNRIVPAAEIPLLALAAPINTAPTVNAGPDGDTSAGNAFSLAGTASDDGLPGSLSLQWEKISGPGPVVFGDAGSVGTTVVGGVAGTYLLRLSAQDGDVRVFDEASFTAAAPASGFATWAGGYNLGALNGPNDDADRDGFSNIVEYALGSNPALGDAAGRFSPGRVPVGGVDHFSVTFTPQQVAGLTYIMQSGSNLTTWTDVTLTGLVSGQPYTYVDSVPMGGANPRRFLRLKIVQP